MSHRGQTEGEYNDAALTRADWRSSAALLDGRFIRLPDQYPVEACDILSDRGEFIHVKRKARSSTLSHLWEQAFVSAQLLRRSAEARFQVCRHIEEACDDVGLAARLQERVAAIEGPNHGSVCVFALIGSWQRARPRSLPFFSRIALHDACLRVQDLGVHSSA